MLIPINWLKEYIDIDNIDTIHKALLQAGLEIEEVLDYQNKEKVLKVEVTPNRGDWASIIGVARELGALTKYNLSQPRIKKISRPNFKTEDIFKLRIEADQACRKYILHHVREIVIGESDKKIKTRLEQIGEKTINNIVDITNYVMFELGQPLHAFDADKIDGNKIIVRFAKKGETIHLINGKVIDLTPEDLVIADQNKPVALAGIMGGLETEVSKKTESILLEAAWFEPKLIRASLKRHSKKIINTEASYRFERYVDPKITKTAAQLALALIINSNREAKIGRSLTEMTNLPRQNRVDLDINKINNLIGLELSKEEIKASLKSFGFEIEQNQAIAPSWRSDISIVADLAEEVARYYGYNNLPKFSLDKQKSKISDSNWYKLELLKDYIAQKGFIEVYNYSFITPEDVEMFNLAQEKLLECINPVDPDNKYMRNSLVPGLIKSLAKNQQEAKLAIFEIGQVFSKKIAEQQDYRLRLGLTSYGVDEDKLDKLIRGLENKLNVDSMVTNYRRSSKDDKKLFDKYKIRKAKVSVVEFDLKDANLDWLENKLTMPPKTGFNYSQVSKYPEVSRDLAFVVEKGLQAKNVEEYIKKLDELIVRVELFDEFAHDKFGKNKKNIAYHIFFQAPDRTLTDKEVNKLVTRAVKKVESKFKANLRDS